MLHIKKKIEIENIFCGKRFFLWLPRRDVGVRKQLGIKFLCPQPYRGYILFYMTKMCLIEIMMLDPRSL